jgi:hypothetical protein
MAQSVFGSGGGAVSSNGSKCEKTISGVIKKTDTCGTRFWPKTFTAKKIGNWQPAGGYGMRLYLIIPFYGFFTIYVQYT